MIKEIFNLINSDNTVHVNRYLVHALGLNAALFYATLLSKQAYYKQHSMLDEDGYFYSTIEDMEESTCLSRFQQNRAINILVKAGLIDFQTGGVHCRRHFRVRNDVEALKKQLKKGEEKSQSIPAENN